jgi:hypothetical protein
MRAGVRAGHPSVMVLKHGPADPSDLEASVKQYRVLLKTVEQVMFFFPAYVFFLKYAGPKYASQDRRTQHYDAAGGGDEARSRKTKSVKENKNTHRCGTTTNWWR